MQQQGMGEQLGQRRRRWQGRVVYQCACDGRTGDADQHRCETGQSEAAEAFPDRTGRRLHARQQIRCQCTRGEIAAEHEKHLYRHSRVVIKPVDQSGQMAARHLGHRAVGDQVMQHDELRGDRLQRVEKRDAR